MEKKNKIAVIFPTDFEGRVFMAKAPELIGCRVSCFTGGVGMAETASATAQVIIHEKPDLLILAGIAGAYPSSGLTYGDCVITVTETIADQGAMRDGEFVPLYQQIYECPIARKQQCFPVVAGITVACCGRTEFPAGPAVQNMEGGTFFSVCLALGQPFLEVRAVSNMTTDRRGEWKMDVAVRNLSEALIKIIDEFEAGNFALS